jgi:hypothetical protein
MKQTVARFWSHEALIDETLHRLRETGHFNNEVFDNIMAMSLGDRELLAVNLVQQLAPDERRRLAGRVYGVNLAVAFRANSDFQLETAATFSFVPGVSWSDHRSFWRQGYRAVMITDTAFYRYRHYHQPSDTPDKLAYFELARATSGLFAAFSELGSKFGGRRAEARPP